MTKVLYILSEPGPQADRIADLLRLTGFTEGEILAFPPGRRTIVAEQVKRQRTRQWVVPGLVYGAAFGAFFGLLSGGYNAGDYTSRRGLWWIWRRILVSAGVGSVAAGVFGAILAYFLLRQGPAQTAITVAGRNLVVLRVPAADRRKIHEVRRQLAKSGIVAEMIEKKY